MAIGTPSAAAAGNAGTGSATLAATFSRAVASGEYLLAWCTSNSGSSTTPFVSVSDPVNGNWLPASIAFKGGLGWGQWYYVASSGALTTSQAVTLTINGTGSSKTIQVSGTTGLHPGPPDVATPGVAASTSTPSSASGVLTYASELVMAGVASFAAGGSPAWSAPFTGLNAGVQAGTAEWGATAYDIVASAASVTAAATLSSGGATLTQIVSVPALGSTAEHDQAAAAEAFTGQVLAAPPYLICKGSTGPGSSTFAQNVANANAAGDLLAAWVTCANLGSAPLSVSDPVNGTWTPVGQPAQYTSGSSNGIGQWFIMPNAGALTPVTQQVSAAFNGTLGNKEIIVYGCPGLSQAPLDQAPPPASGSDTAPVISSGALAAPGELALVGAVNQGAGGVPSWAAPFAWAGDKAQYGTGLISTVAWAAVTGQSALTASGTIISAPWALSMITLTPFGYVSPDDAAGSVEQFTAAQPPSTTAVLADTAGAADAVTGGTAVPQADKAAAADAVALAITKTLRDFAAARDRVAASGTDTIIFHPPAAAPTALGETAVQVVQEVPPAVPPFIPNTLPRLYLQNILTGEWVNRDVQGQVNPQVTWQLNAAGTYSVTLAPPRADMLDASGNPKLRLWQTAAYLEQADKIRWGGILTSMSAQGPELALQFTEFAGYPNGMIYEGPVVSNTRWDALDAIRYLWGWLQGQPDSDLGMVLDNAMSGVLLGDVPQFGTSTTLAQAAQEGDTVIHIVPLPHGAASQWTAKAAIQVGGDHAVIKATIGPGIINLQSGLFSYQPAGSIVALYSKPSPYVLAAYNSTDIGSEISSIQSEAVFDFREVHSWGDQGKASVSHQLRFGVPRLGTRRMLRFAEGENIIAPVQCAQDGTKTGNDVIGLGAGQGTAQVRSAAAVRNGTLRRSVLYQNQAVDRPDRLGILVQKALTSVLNPDSVTQITLMDHPNARFGTFSTGDDIPVTLCTGWRNTVIWSRILSVQQVPATNLMTLTLARSDSFAYIPASGQAGTI